MPNEVDIIEDDILKNFGKDVLEVLLKDQTISATLPDNRQCNIFWATHDYESRGNGYGYFDEIRLDLITAPNDHVIMPRVLKAKLTQYARIRERAEVFSPSWLCNMMNNFIDDQWFGKSGIFNIESNDHHSWVATKGKIEFPADKTWKDYVNRRILEVTCGEAPFIVSRYDTTTGEEIKISDRIGFLNRKIRVINENVSDEADWVKWVQKAYQSIYGFEWQGDNLLLAREALLYSYIENYQVRFAKTPKKSLLLAIANIISWNIWQMDGLTYTLPSRKAQQEATQLSLFEEPVIDSVETVPFCQIIDWQKQKVIKVADIKNSNKINKLMKFDIIIGNPPYQEETDSDSTRKPPIYNFFIDEAYKNAQIVDLITPARFLFNAGYTPKPWNKKMLNDEHIKVPFYESVSANVFANTDIKGGVAVTYRDSQRKLGPIGTFTKFQELNSIFRSVSEKNPTSIETIISSPLSYQLSSLMKQEHPELTDRLRSSAFTTLDSILFDSKPNDGKDYISLVGLLNSKRVTKYIRRDYIKDISGTLDKYTVLISKANGAGHFGETLSPSIIAKPSVGYTQTFIGLGKFDTMQEAENASKYVKTKFARAMLGILKITQDCPGPKWKYVPLQDFSSSSDIEWSKSVSEIDEQLFVKYGLNEKEKNFIRTQVKEMK